MFHRKAPRQPKHASPQRKARRTKTKKALTPRHKAAPLLQAKRHMGKWMDSDPLKKKQASSRGTLVGQRTQHTWMAPNGHGSVSVMLLGYETWLGQHMFTHLVESGFELFPVFDKDPPPTSPHFGQLTYDKIAANGLPDMDFVINCSGGNPWVEGFSKVSEQRAQRSKQFVQYIRETSTKPFAFVNFSSLLIYPPSEETVYTEDYVIRGLSPIVHDSSEIAAFDYQNKISDATALVRNFEAGNRVFIPELDYRTPEQMAEYKRAKELYDRTKIKSTVHSQNQNYYDPELLRQQSPKYGLLENSSIRSLNMRVGTVLCRHMEEAKAVNLDFAGFNYVGDGSNIQPWVHVDDLCRMTIEAMNNADVDGGVNAVAPTMATNKEISEFMIKVNSAFKKWSPLTRDELARHMHPEMVSLFTDTRKVEPKLMQEVGFKFLYPSIQSIWDNGGYRSFFEADVYSVGGEQNLHRNASRSLH